MKNHIVNVFAIISFSPWSLLAAILSSRLQLLRLGESGYQGDGEDAEQKLAADKAKNSAPTVAANLAQARFVSAAARRNIEAA